MDCSFGAKQQSLIYTYNGHPVANTEYENMIQFFHWGTYF